MLQTPSVRAGYSYIKNKCNVAQIPPSRICVCRAYARTILHTYLPRCCVETIVDPIHDGWSRKWAVASNVLVEIGLVL